MKFKDYFLIVFLSILIESYCLGQDRRTPITVNSLIGDTLGLEERNYFLLFQNFEGFQWAVFYLNSDSTIDAKITYIKNGLNADTLIENFTNLTSLDYNLKLKYAFDNPDADTDRDGVTDLDELSKYKTNPLKPENDPLQPNDQTRVGKEITIYQNNGMIISGELLSVRQNSLLLRNPQCDNDFENIECIDKINYTDIDRLVIKGSSYVALGVGLGIAASAIAGVIIGVANSHSSMGFDINPHIGPILGASAILISLGTAIGKHNSAPDKEFISFTEDDIKGLSAYSRYLYNEPEWLQKME